MIPIGGQERSSLSGLQTANCYLVGVGNTNDVVAHRAANFLPVDIDKLFLDVADSKKKEE